MTALQTSHVPILWDTTLAVGGSTAAAFGCPELPDERGSTCCRRACNLEINPSASDSGKDCSSTSARSHMEDKKSCALLLVKNCTRTASKSNSPLCRNFSASPVCFAARPSLAETENGGNALPPTMLRAVFST